MLARRGFPSDGYTKPYSRRDLPSSARLLLWCEACMNTVSSASPSGLRFRAIIIKIPPMTKASQDRVLEWAQRVFETDELAKQYLGRQNAIFGGLAPIQIAKTNRGADWVIEELTQAAYGFAILPTKRGGKAPAPAKM